jgi:hypothetical protein
MGGMFDVIVLGTGFLEAARGDLHMVVEAEIVLVCLTNFVLAEATRTFFAALSNVVKELVRARDDPQEIRRAFL